MALFLIVAFLLIPIAEIAVFIQVGDLIGLWPTLFGIVFTAILGGLLVRKQGFETLRRSRVSLDRNELPVAELFDGLCILVAGALLLTPGFLTDTMGFLLLVPPLRAVLRKALWAELLRRGSFVHVQRGGTGPGAPHGEAPRHRGDGSGGQVIEGEFTDVTEGEDEDRDPRRTDGGERRNPWRPNG